jgi:hypothetical protein
MRVGTTIRRSSKPCPGCGETDKRRRVDELCDDCKGTLALATALERLLRSRVAEGEVVRRVPEVNWSHWLPYVQHEHPERSNAVSEAFLTLAFAIGERISADVPGQHYGIEPTPLDDTKLDTRKPLVPGSSGGEVALLLPSRKIADALDVLYMAIQRLGVDAYNQGLTEGANLLMQLHAGAVTLDDFDRHIKLRPFNEKEARRR